MTCLSDNHPRNACNAAGDPPSWRRWAVQMLEWVTATVLARAVCGIVIVGLRRLLVSVARGLDGVFAGHPTAELFSVMLACPLVMNLVQVRCAEQGRLRR